MEAPTLLYAISGLLGIAGVSRLLHWNEVLKRIRAKKDPDGHERAAQREHGWYEWRFQPQDKPEMSAQQGPRQEIGL